MVPGILPRLCRSSALWRPNALLGLPIRSHASPPLLLSSVNMNDSPPLLLPPPFDWVATTPAHLDARKVDSLLARLTAWLHVTHLLGYMLPTNPPECAAGASDARYTARHTARHARHPSRAPSTPTSRPAQWRSQWGRRGSGWRGGGGAWPPAGERGLGRERGGSVGSPPCHRAPERKLPGEGARGGADSAANKSRCLSRQSAAERPFLLLLLLPLPA